METLFRRALQSGGALTSSKLNGQFLFHPVTRVCVCSSCTLRPTSLQRGLRTIRKMPRNETGSTINRFAGTLAAPNLMNDSLERVGRPWQFPPLVARELLVYSRQSWTYWLRLLSALGAVSVLGIMGATGQNRVGQADGLSLFAGSTAVLFFIASLNGLRSTADCIASERRQGTLVLLFLADLKLHTILISKLVTNSLRNVWAFLGTLPVLGLCLLLGGVSGLMFVQGVLAVLAAAWLSLMVGLDQSCRNQGEHEAFSNGLRELLKLNLVPFISPASLVWSALLPGRRFFGACVFLGDVRNNRRSRVVLLVQGEDRPRAQLAAAASGRSASGFQRACIGTGAGGGTSSETAEALRRHAARLLALCALR
jgi:hypothetical protein